MRFLSKDEHGETRTERNARFNMAHRTPEEPDVPEYLSYMLGWFWQLSSRRKSGMGGPEPIGFDEIGRWAELTRNAPLPEEVDIILALDSAYMEAVAAEHNAKDEQEAAPRLKAPPK